VAALDAYRNPDGGYGWGLEPDLRSPESQPGAAHHAFEVFEEIAPTSVSQAAELCDWLGSITLSDHGDHGRRPPGRRKRREGRGPSMARPGDRVLHEGDRGGERSVRIGARILRPLRGRPPQHPAGGGERLLDHLGTFVPADGKVAVRGGAEGETLHALDLAPYPGRPARTLFDESVIAADLDRLAALQQDDGGWVVDFMKISPAGSLDWRGYATVDALDVLRRHGRLPS
jgi:hypothetical protein